MTDQIDWTRTFGLHLKSRPDPFDVDLLAEQIAQVIGKCHAYAILSDMPEWLTLAKMASRLLAHLRDHQDRLSPQQQDASSLQHDPPLWQHIGVPTSDDAE